MINLKSDSFELKNIGLVIFDKDGTIFDIHKYWSEVINMRAHYICELDVVKKKTELKGDLLKTLGLMENGLINPNGPIGIKSRKEIINIIYQKLHDNSLPITITDLEVIFREVDLAIERKSNALIAVLPGVAEKIKKLHSLGCLIALASSDISSRSIKTLKFSNLYKYFNSVVCSDDVKNPKPACDSVDKIMHDLKYNHRDRIVLIGDSVADQETAKKSKISFIGVGTGLKSKRFITLTKNYLHSFNELEVYTDMSQEKE